MPLISGKPLPNHARLALLDIMIAAGVQQCEVTSVARTPAEQARVMYENCIGTGPVQGPEKQHQLYKDPGDLVIDVFEQNRAKPRDEAIELMRQKIVEIGPQLVSRHCCDPSVITVFDVAPSSIPFTKRLAFEQAVEADPRVSKFLSPHEADPAYHIEMPVADVAPPVIRS